ncbi:MAG: MotA/TolQ/ExbB proton channel family protein [Isosphaeraceae bacterium]
MIARACRPTLPRLAWALVLGSLLTLAGPGPRLLQAQEAQKPGAPPIELIDPAGAPPPPAASEKAPESNPAASKAPLPKARPAASPVPKSSRTAANDPSAIGRRSVVRLFVEANPMLWPLLLCSVVAFGYALERLIALRRERVIPRDFVNRFLERLAGGKLDRDRATELCRANDSAMARVFAVVIGYWGQPAATIRQAVGYDAAGEVLDLKRNIRVLNGTATLAPLLGLLGTVIGMIQSFDALGGRGGTAKGEALAHGISLALVATALGLAIAVVSVVAYYFLLNKVDLLVRELDDNARKAIELVSAEAIRPPSPERRPNFLNPGDHPRHESRTHLDR